MKTLEELIDHENDALPLLREWVKKARNSIEILPPSDRREKELLGAQVSTRSILGTVAYHTGGLAFDEGWIRLFGSGNERLERTLYRWNKPNYDAGLYWVADDAIGGLYAMNRGSFDTKLGTIHFWPPDGLEWESTDLQYSEFVEWLTFADLEKYYDGLRWPGWREDIFDLNLDRCFFFYPPLFTEEGSVVDSHRSDVPSQENVDFRAESLRQLGT